MDPRAKPEPSLGELFGELSRETGALVRQEVKLAGAELGQKARRAGTAAVVMVLGGALAQAGLLGLMAAAVIFLARYLGPGVSAALVGGLFAGVGAAACLRGLASLKQLQLTPTQTLQTLREDKAMLKEQFR